MGEISIKINIADRVYPLKVNMEEEEIIRRAAKLINDRVKEYQENYAVRDKPAVDVRVALCNVGTESGEEGLGRGYRCGRKGLPVRSFAERIFLEVIRSYTYRAYLRFNRS
jgi:hypothetical protein